MRIARLRALTQTSISSPSVLNVRRNEDCPTEGIDKQKSGLSNRTFVWLQK